jgi:RNA polymerase sigma factor (TIGR02999 family)
VVYSAAVNDVTRILTAIDTDPAAAEQLLPLVYEELRKLAAQKLAQEKPGQTLQATALVHEAYVRLVESAQPPAAWNGRGHFFAAAAEAMRRILVEEARRKQRHKHGGGRQKLPLDSDFVADDSDAEELLAINDALERLAAQDPQAAELVKLRYFSGLSVEEAAAAMNIPRSSAYVQWSFARAALRVLFEPGRGGPAS